MILMHGMTVVLILAACLTGVETMEMSGAEQAVENPAERPGGVETGQMRSIAEQNAESFLKEFFSFNKDDRRALFADTESTDEQMEVSVNRCCISVRAFTNASSVKAAPPLLIRLKNQSGPV